MSFSLSHTHIFLSLTHTFLSPVNTHSLAFPSVTTFQNEGIFALWKGFFAQWVRIGPHTLTAFVVLERLRHIFGLEAVGT